MTALPWFDAPWQQWQSYGLAQRPPQALRLQAPPGWGLIEFSQQLVQAVLCEQPQASGQGCGQCHGCRLLSQHNHPDHHWIQPEDKKSSLGIDQIRQVIVQASQQPVLGRQQVFVFDLADELTTEAANALLKLLEEPGAERLLLLLCHQPARLLPTLASRCQTLVVPASDPDALAWLSQQRPQVDWPARYLLAGLAPLPALAMTDAEFETRHQGVQALLQIASQQRSSLDWPVADKDGLLRLFDWLYRLCHELLQIRLGGELNPVSMLGLAMTLAQQQRLAASIEGRFLRHFIDELIQQRRELSQSLSLNAGMQTDRLLIQWSRLFRGYV